MKSIRPISPGMLGMDESFKVLDFRDNKLVFLCGKNVNPCDTMFYRIEGTDLYLSYKSFENLSKDEDDLLFRILNLTQDTLLIKMIIVKKGATLSYKELIELTYVAKN